MTAQYETIIYEGCEPGITRVTLNRPERMNSYTWQMCQELKSAIERFSQTSSERVLVLTGAGRAFCSGGDVASDPERYWDGAQARRLGDGLFMRESMHGVIRALYDLDKPVIAMVNGPAVSGGLALALVCDLRIAGDEARLGDSSAKFALLPDEGGAWLFPHFMRPDLARRMVLKSEIYDAHTAQAIGLVTEVVPQAELAERTMEEARALAAAAPLAVQLAKRMMRFSERGTLDETLKLTELAVTIGNHSPDVTEGVQAFLEKRRPDFSDSRSRDA